MIRTCPVLVAVFAVLTSPAIACGPPLSRGASIAPPKWAVSAERGQQQRDNREAFGRFALGEANLAAVHDVMRKQIASFPSACNAITFSKQGWGLSYSGDLRMDLDRNIPLSRTKWGQSASADNCGTTKSFHVLNSVREDGTIKRTVEVPGETLTGWPEEPTLQRRAIAAALHGAASAKPAGCGHRAVVDTAAVMEFHPSAPVRTGCGSYEPEPWKENWTVAACGQRINVTLKFTPSGKRTQVKEIARLPPPDIDEDGKSGSAWPD
jgi:hypothetical protein